MLDRIIVAAGAGLLATVVAWPIAIAALWLSQFLPFYLMLPVFPLVFIAVFLYDWYTEGRQQ